MRCISIILALNLFASCSAPAKTLPDFSISQLTSSSFCSKMHCKTISYESYNLNPGKGSSAVVSMDGGVNVYITLKDGKLEDFAFLLRKNPAEVVQKSAYYSQVLSNLFIVIFGKKAYMTDGFFVPVIKEGYKKTKAESSYVIQVDLPRINEDSTKYTYEIRFNFDKTDYYPNNKYLYLYGFKKQI